MSYETRKPNIKIVFGDDWFNLLIAALEANAKITFDEELSRQATQLMEKLLTYSRPYENEDGESRVDVRFFPDEASEMIWQLLVKCTCFFDKPYNFYEELKKNHVTKTKNKNTQ